FPELIIAVGIIPKDAAARSVPVANEIKQLTSPCCDCFLIDRKASATVIAPTLPKMLNNITQIIILLRVILNFQS
ncbi:MAG: hypothetical protein P8Y23_09060, partial [Candidatus Lokiarchaeota archaeon]